MKGGHGTTTAGHSNRVFSTKFVPHDDNMILSGGWDNTVQIWDIRVQHAVRSIFGPHIAGDALDIVDDEIITGSWRPENPLEVWDYKSGKLKNVIPWNQSALKSEPCFLYAATFSPGGDLIAAGGSGANEAKVFDHTRDNALVGTIAGLSRGVFTLDFSPNGEQLAVAGADATLRIIDVYDSNRKVETERPGTPSIKNAVPEHQTDPVIRSAMPTSTPTSIPANIMTFHTEE